MSDLRTALDTIARLAAQLRTAEEERDRARDEVAALRSALALVVSGKFARGVSAGLDDAA